MLEALASTVSRVRASSHPSFDVDVDLSERVFYLSVCVLPFLILFSPSRILQRIPTSSRMILTSLPGPLMSLYVKKHATCIYDNTSI